MRDLAGNSIRQWRGQRYTVVALSEALVVQLEPLGIGVSVLCPEFVRTRIMASERNRSKRYGPRQAPDPAGSEGQIAAWLAECVQSGIDPSDVAKRALEAIGNGDLDVLTHPHMRAAVEQRLAVILAAMDKVVDC